MKTLYTRKEAAHFLGISLATLDRLSKNGFLGRTTVPGLSHPRYHIEDLEGAAVAREQELCDSCGKMRLAGTLETLWEHPRHPQTICERCLNA